MFYPLIERHGPVRKKTETRALTSIERSTIPFFMRGWCQYYGRFYKSEMYPVLPNVERYLILWARRKYKRLARHGGNARRHLGCVCKRTPGMFEHWKLGLGSPTEWKPDESRGLCQVVCPAKAGVFSMTSDVNSGHQTFQAANVLHRISVHMPQGIGTPVFSAFPACYRTSRYIL